MRLLLILSMLGLGVGCSPATSRCTTSTCSGCCDSTGTCLSGTTESGCGSGGLACTQCGADSFCNVGFCTPRGSSNLGGGTGATGGGAGGGTSTGGGGGTSSCGPQTCSGCCNGGVCQPGNQATACGSGGQACSACSGACSDNQCTGSTCNPSNCQGCCNGNRCETGLTATTCGAGGLTCTACGEGQSCSGGRCGGGSTCNSENCPDGCCAGNVCQPGTSPSACGTGGAECGTCTSAQSCNGTQCVSTSSCNVTTCPGGCCQGSVCQAGTMSAACGTGGATCASCTTNQVCNGTSCVAACNSTTCPSGCCQGEVCQPGTSLSACGARGASCNVCSGSQSCTSQACSGGSLAGDTCDTAALLTPPFTVSQSLVGYGNDFVTTGASCRATQGIDRMTKVSVPAGQRLTVTVTPTVSTFDPTVSLVMGLPSACAGTSAACAASADVGIANEAETTGWTNITGSTQTVFIIVDDYTTTATDGAYTLSASIGAPLAGETCSLAVSASSGVAVSRTPSSYSDDYQGTGSGCLTPSVGPDFVLAYTVPNNQSLTVTATPASGLNVSVNFATSLAACGSRTCVASASDGAEGEVETVGWNNTTGATVTVFVIIDTPVNPVGSVSSVGTVGAVITCSASTCANGCCQGGTCVAGTVDSACGTGGVACATCTSPDQCNANQVCSATSLSTGSTCTSSTQCYQSVFGTAECRTSWPGGYCTGTCLLTEQACGGILFNAGWCTAAGECLLECAGAGTGQSTCRTGYVCDFSNGAGSQGVCIPRCQQVGCTSGSCNTAGYCR